MNVMYQAQLRIKNGFGEHEKLFGDIFTSRELAFENLLIMISNVEESSDKVPLHGEVLEKRINKSHSIDSKEIELLREKYKELTYIPQEPYREGYERISAKVDFNNTNDDDF